MTRSTGDAARLRVQSPGLYTLTLHMREDGLRLDRLLLTTDPTYLPVDFGPVESERLTGATTMEQTIDHIINYDYDNLYRLTGADYSTGEQYAYDYDPVGNRLQQIINGDTTAYLYDAANRLQSVNGETYTFDANGNLLATGVMTNVFDTANRLVESTRNDNTVQPIYNGVNDRVGQTVGVTTTYFALDVQGLPEVIYTSEGNAYLHLPGVIVAESAAGETRYLLSDGLGSVRQGVDDTGSVVAYNEFDPYGNPTQNSALNTQNYGFTGEWWQSEVGLLHLRARWYSAGDGVFLSRDAVESEPAYQYVRGNVVNRVDPSGMQGIPGRCQFPPCENPFLPSDWDEFLKMLSGISDNVIEVATMENLIYTYVGPIAKLSGVPDEVAFLARDSHTQEVDGFIVGLGGSYNLPYGLRDKLVEWGVFSDRDFALNGDCLPRSGGAGGFEIVYDFKHQERGTFRYSGSNKNLGSILNAGGVYYVGTTRGFATQQGPDGHGYFDGVGAYGGYFGAGSLSANTPIANVGVVAIEAVPLDESQNTNPNGVFATYYGVGLGLAVSPLPANTDVSVTYYSLVFGGHFPGRVQYGLSPWEQWSLNGDEKAARQKEIPRRKVAAARMTVEILTSYYVETGGLGPLASHHAHAIAQLWSFVERP